MTTPPERTIHISFGLRASGPVEFRRGGVSPFSIPVNRAVFSVCAGARMQQRQQQQRGPDWPSHVIGSPYTHSPSLLSDPPYDPKGQKGIARLARSNSYKMGQSAPRFLVTAARAPCLFCVLLQGPEKKKVCGTVTSVLSNDRRAQVSSRFLCLAPRSRPVSLGSV